MRLILTVDIDIEESGLNEAEIRYDTMQFARDLLIIGAEDMEIGLTVWEAECVD